MGGLLPAVAVFVSIPLLLSRLGGDAYGALVLITSIVGYFGIIDVNATAGSVKYVAEHRARGEHDDVNRVVSFGLLLYALIGLVGGTALFLSAELLVTHVFRIDASWSQQAVLALQVSAFAFFFGQLQQYLQSIPQALHRFDLSGQFDALFGTLAPLSTIGVVLLGGALVEIVAARLVLSLVHCAVLVGVVRLLLPTLRLHRPDRKTTRKVSSFSAYSYLQRLAAITYGNADKLLISANHSLGALTTYVVPYTLVNRVYALLSRLMQAIFPLASSLSAVDDMAELRTRYVYVSRYMLFLNVCVCLLLALFAQELLHYWLHTKMDPRAHVIVVIVAFALLADSLTNVPSLVNDGLGRPHITGITAIIRVAVGVAAAWWALSVSGIIALALSQLAVSWLMSVAFLLYVHRRSLPWRLGEVARPIFVANGAMLLLGSIVMWARWGSPVLSWWAFVAAMLVLLCLLTAVGWFLILLPEHRVRLSTLAAYRLVRPLRG